ncbi:MAG TPA: 4-hydroxythreonine-4-phosphate dehydrogenase PdxA [Woeseiaceae bacterium]
MPAPTLTGSAILKFPLANRPLVVTAGEPAGIGPELCLELARSGQSDGLVIVADPAMLKARAAKLGWNVTLREFDPAGKRGARAEAGELVVMAQTLPNCEVCGIPDPRNSASLLEGIKRAVEGCSSGSFAALVTAPLQKSAINDAGIPFTGHTEYLAELTSTRTPVMLLVAADLRVALASTHMPLKDVSGYLTRERLRSVIEVLNNDLTTRFRISRPSILVCGLNPHAGEAGHLGSEEQDVIAPVVAEMRDRGIDVRGPVPADTAFTPAAGKADAVLAMYHDQGLPVLKYAGFGTAVNVTLGLPIVRTSVDHGTALDIAGTGKADPGSMLAAVELAATLVAA